MFFLEFSQRKNMNNKVNSILRFISNNQSKLVMLLFVVAVLDYVARFPYFNILLVFPYPWNTTRILWVVTAILFRLDERFSFGTALVLVCIITAASMFGRGSFVETFGNDIYSLLLLGFVQTMMHRSIRSGV